MMIYRPLVTVGVVSYKSSRTIIETLESIYSQDYDNIELVVSDDGSNDNAKELCEKWLISNGRRFKSIKLVFDKDNKGTTFNCNRVIDASTGEWVAILAADDILYPNCITSYINYVDTHPNVSWIIPKYHTYLGDFKKENRIVSEDKKFSTEWKQYFELDAREQFLTLVKYNFIFSPTDFRKKSSYSISGIYDTKYGLLEDYSMSLMATNNGLKCHLLDEFLVGYRMGITNVSANTKRLFNIEYSKNRYDLCRDYCFNYYKWNEKAYERIHYSTNRLFHLFHWNNACNMLNKILYRLLDYMYCIFLFGRIRK